MWDKQHITPHQTHDTKLNWASCLHWSPLGQIMGAESNVCFISEKAFTWDWKSWQTYCYQYKMHWHRGQHNTKLWRRNSSGHSTSIKKKLISIPLWSGPSLKSVTCSPTKRCLLFHFISWFDLDRGKGTCQATFHTGLFWLGWFCKRNENESQ